MHLQWTPKHHRIPLPVPLEHLELKPLSTHSDLTAIPSLLCSDGKWGYDKQTPEAKWTCRLLIKRESLCFVWAIFQGSFLLGSVPQKEVKERHILSSWILHSLLSTCIILSQPPFYIYQSRRKRGRQWQLWTGIRQQIVKRRLAPWRRWSLNV